MYGLGEKVFYGAHGICVVTGAEEKEVDRKQLTYLVLEPIPQDGSRFMVPTHNEVTMGKVRPIMAMEEWNTLLQSQMVRENAWIPEENQRKRLYRELIGSGDRTRLMTMVHTLYRHQESLRAAGRKCHLCDETFLRDAEKLLSGELSVVMQTDPLQARQYLRQSLDFERK